MSIKYTRIITMPKVLVISKYQYACVCVCVCVCVRACVGVGACMHAWVCGVTARRAPGNNWGNKCPTAVHFLLMSEVQVGLRVPHHHGIASPSGY